MARRLSRSRSLLNLDEEYRRALRTQSFVDMWSKVHHQLDRATTTTAATTARDEQVEGLKLDTHYSSSPLTYSYYTHLPEFLLEPSQESLLLAAAAASTSQGALLADFFDTTLQACTACTSLLASIGRARSHHRSLLARLLSLLSPHPASAFSDLSSHLDLDNPLSPHNLAHFHRIHARYAPLVRRLTAAHRKILRRAKLLRIAKKAAEVALIAALGTAAVAALAIAAHAAAALAGAVVAPAVVGPAARWVRRRVEGARARHWERAGARVDAAAKGAYIIERDMDTMSRLVRTAHDEVEHGRDVARLAVRSTESWQLVREVAREMEDGEAGLEVRLQELEEHVYLCLTTINRSRRLVAQELLGDPQHI